MRHLVLAATLTVASATIASATGGFDCVIDDGNMTLSISAPVSRGMGGVILSYEATAEITAEIVPEALRKPDLSAGLVHHWLDYPDLWLAFYAETQGDAPFASMDIILKATGTDEEGSYSGDYTLSVFDGETGEVTELTGKVACTGE